MKKWTFAEEQIALASRQAEGGVPIVEVCRRMGVSEQTFYRWKKQFAGMRVAEVRRLKQLEEDNRSSSPREGRRCRHCIPEFA